MSIENDGDAGQPNGSVTLRKTSLDEYNASVKRLLDTVSLPPNTRVWVVAILDGSDLTVTVRAGAGDVIGEYIVPQAPSLLDELADIRDDHREAALDDLKMGIAKTMAALVAGRSG